LQIRTNGVTESSGTTCKHGPTAAEPTAERGNAGFWCLKQTGEALAVYIPLTGSGEGYTFVAKDGKIFLLFSLLLPQNMNAVMLGFGASGERGNTP